MCAPKSGPSNAPSDAIQTAGDIPRSRCVVRVSPAPCARWMWIPFPSRRAAARIAVIVSGVCVSVAWGVIIGRISPSSAPFTSSAKARFASISRSVSGTERASTPSSVRRQMGKRRAVPGIIPPG